MLYGTIACLGDSLTYGARCEGDGWPELLPGELATRSRADLIWSTLNRGVCGERTWDVLRRTPGVVRELTSTPGSRWLVVLVGTNDLKGATPSGDRSAATSERYARLLRQLLAWPARSGLATVVCTLPPVDWRGCPEFTPHSDALRAELNRRVSEFAPVDGDWRWQPVVCDLSDIGRDALLDDGVHLSPAGHRTVASRVARIIHPTKEPR